MRHFLSCAVALLLVAALALVGCSSRQEPVNPDTTPGKPDASPKQAADVERTSPPAELVGKWRLEVKDGKSKRTAIYHFTTDGLFEVDTHLVTPTHEVTDLVKRAILKAEKDRITFVDISHTGADGGEDVIPVDRLRPRTALVRVQGDELHWTEVDEDGKPVPGVRPTVLKRVKS